MSGNIQMMARALMAAVLVALSLGAGLDATAARFSQIAESVPITFKSESWLLVSSSSLLSGDPASAYEAARSAVLRKPLDPAVHVGLAEAVQSIGDNTSPLSVAAQLGWRNVDVQRAVVSAALASAASDVAAPRIVALARLRKLDVLSLNDIKLLANSEGFASLYKVFSQEHQVHWLYFFKWLDRQDPGTADQFLVSMPSAVKQTDCKSLISVANLVVGRGRIDVADSILDASCEMVADRAGNSLAFRNSFGSLETGPFDWTFSHYPSISFEIIHEYKKRYIRVLNSDAVIRLFAYKTVRLKSSRYKLSVIALGNDQNITLDNYSIKINCLDADGKINSPENIISNNIIEIPALNCKYQKVLWYAQPGGQKPAIHISLLSER